MTPDAKLVLALLQTVTGWMPPLPVSVRRDQAGEVAVKKLLCPACGGAGTLRKGRWRCHHCDGNGYRLVDPVTLKAKTETTAERRYHRCDACNGQGVHGNNRRCRHCDGTGVRHQPEPTDDQIDRLEAQRRIREGTEAPDTYADWQERKTRWYRQGSYPELDQALTLLELSQPVLHRAITRFVIHAEPVQLSPAMHTLISDGCEHLARLMPRPIRVPAWARTEPHAPGRGRWANGTTQHGRNQEVRRLRAEGFSLVKIGQRVGLTKQRVSQILSEEAA